MLLGEFHHSVDAKGRVFIPARWREELGEGIVVTRGLEGCLYVMSKDRFAELADRLSQMTINRKTNRDYSRILFTGASEEVLDRQGRITIPSTLRQYAKLSRDVVVVGVMHRAEIWDGGAWQEYQGRVQPQYEEIAEKLEM